MEINYKKELENASRSMILVHDPNLLIKLIIRLIVRKVHAKHAGVLLFQPEKDCYVLTISGGKEGMKIPPGFAKFTKENSLVKLFTQKQYYEQFAKKGYLIVSDLNKLIWQESVLASQEEKKEFLNSVIRQMGMFNVLACVPAYFHGNLLALLLLGEKSTNEGYNAEELDFLSALASNVAMAIQNAQLIDDLKKQVDQNKALFINTVLSLASTIEAKDKYTRGHTERVTHYSLTIANELVRSKAVDLPESFSENLYIAGLLHDIGKIGVPESVLCKEGGLTDEEFVQIKEHPLRGAEILKNLPEFEQCLEGVKYHHERYDGRGYPEGLKGEEIPIIAAIVAVADTYDAMTSDRTYRKALSKETAVEEIKKNAGIQFHPIVANAFVDLCSRQEI
ncbi:MAG: HD-GYP domain-containing protein [Candidatus Omnitrophica bacterium]|nr:HD-GYP domain-containing protein [Candidatus Omnitrophota bacterium]